MAFNIFVDKGVQIRGQNSATLISIVTSSLCTAPRSLCSSPISMPRCLCG